MDSRWIDNLIFSCKARIAAGLIMSATGWGVVLAYFACSIPAPWHVWLLFFAVGTTPLALCWWDHRFLKRLQNSKRELYPDAE